MMVSQSAAPAPAVWRDERGQASPSETPESCVLEGGQMGARPSMRMCHSVGRGTIGTEEACVDGWERR